MAPGTSPRDRPHDPGSPARRRFASPATWLLVGCLFFSAQLFSACSAPAERGEAVPAGGSSAQTSIEEPPPPVSSPSPPSPEAAAALAEGERLCEAGGVEALAAADRRLAEAVRLFGRAGDRAGWAAAAIVIGEMEEAYTRIERALALHRAARDRRGEAGALMLRGWGRFLDGAADRALPDYDRALDLYRDAGDRVGEAEVLDRRGSALRALGRLEEARR
jgi:tetratricopeptide (TPR) repeat protein